VFGIGIAMTAVLTLLTPLAAYTRVELLILVRALEGFFEVSQHPPTQLKVDSHLYLMLILHAIGGISQLLKLLITVTIVSVCVFMLSIQVVILFWLS